VTQNWYDYDITELNVTVNGIKLSIPFRYRGHLYSYGVDGVVDLYENEIVSAVAEVYYLKLVNSYAGEKIYFVDDDGTSIHLKEFDVTDESVSILETVSGGTDPTGQFITMNEDDTKVTWLYLDNETAYIREWDISGASGSQLTTRANVLTIYGFGVESDGTEHLSYKNSSDSLHYWDEYTGSWATIIGGSSSAFYSGGGGYTMRQTDVLYPPGSGANSWTMPASGRLYINTKTSDPIQAIQMTYDGARFLELNADYSVTVRRTDATYVLNADKRVVEIKDVSQILTFVKSSTLAYEFRPRTRNLF